jgi:hypothetical protein
MISDFRQSVSTTKTDSIFGFYLDFFLIGQETEGIGVSLIRKVIFPLDENPVTLVEVRKQCVPLDDRVDPRDVHAIGKRERLPVDLSAARHEDLVIIPGNVKSRGERVCHGHTVNVKLRIPGHDHHDPTGQRTPHLIPGLASHDQVMAQGESLEPLEIGRHPPRQVAVKADHAVGGDRDDDGDHGAHPPTRGLEGLRA